MKRNRIHVLIVDDDNTQGAALLEAFTRAGYQAVWCNTSVKALTTAQRQEFHCLIVDCMLPKMNGMDLVDEIKQVAVTPPKVFMFSGIYKDKSFIKGTMERTQAEAFFVKPFDLKKMMSQVDEVLHAEAGEDDPPLLELYGAKVIGDNELTRLIQAESTIHSVHLPMLYKRLLHSTLSGELTLIYGAGDMSAISFYNGQIYSVRTPDKDTYFGGLAVGFGFVSPDEVMEALRDSSGKLLGQKLIDSMSLSPHAIHVILEEQLALRLSQTLQSGVVSLQWTAKTYASPDYVLNPIRFESLLTDWTVSKVDPSFIKAHLSLWGAFTLHGHFHQTIPGAMAISELLSHGDFAELDLSYLYRQLLLGNATIGSKSGDMQNFDFLENRLAQLLDEYKTQNYFQVLGVGEKAHSLELNKAFNDLKEHFDPKNLPTGAPPSVMVKCTKVFQQIETAFKTLSDDVARNRYVLVQQNKRAQEQLENEPIFRAAILELQNGQPKEAAKRFQSLIDKKIPFKDLRAYRIWAGLKSEKRFSQMTLDQVPPEERHSAPYMMAKGVQYKQKGYISKALECFRTAHILDPRLAIARAELEKLKNDLERRGNRDLVKEVTTVIDSLFGKIRRGA
jgi:CheY-like chemotaxis protein